MILSQLSNMRRKGLHRSVLQKLRISDTATGRSMSSRGTSNFIDTAKIRVCSGKGGDGSVHFARQPYQVMAAPDGGNGGPGSNIWIQIVASSSSSSSSHFSSAGGDLSKWSGGMCFGDLAHLKTRYSGWAGGKGGERRQRGSNGVDIVVPVPKGTLISQYTPPNLVKKSDNSVSDDVANEELKLSDSKEESAEIDKEEAPKKKRRPQTVRENDEPLFIDSSHPLMPVGTKFLVCRGGRGGRGNHSFSSSVNRSPDHADPGAPGELRYLSLEMKTICDIGLIGLPNAGKSSFARAVSRCQTKVADYAFTTLRPN